MNDEQTVRMLQALSGQSELRAFAVRLGDWLKRDADGQSLAFGESRARAVLRAGNLADEATLSDFARRVKQEAFLRVALYDLLQDTGLAEENEVRELGLLSPAAGGQAPGWLALIVAGYAWRGGYPLQRLDPAAPPSPNTPAGQSLRRAAHFLRRQIQRSATERDRLAHLLAQPPSGAPSLDQLAPSQGTIAPLPPHFRPPVPERYPEMASETIQVTVDEAVEAPRISVGEPLVISPEEVGASPAASSEAVRQQPITIERDQVTPGAPPSPMPASAVVMPAPTAGSSSRPNLTVALRQMFRQERLASTKLRVVVQEYPDGPGLYGLQVRVSCKGVKSFVAGTTSREGRFTCELPVRVHTGLTYDVDVTWPREEGGETERKSITLHADRTQFILPFYRHLNAPEDV